MSETQNTSFPFTPSEVVSSASLEAALKKIKAAATAGAISAGLTLAFALFSVLITPVFKMTWASLVDAGIIAGLSYGIYRKSRVSAITLLCFFVYAKIHFFFIDPLYASAGLISGAIFIYFFFQGVVGCFQYQRMYKLTHNEPITTNSSEKSRKIRFFWGIIFASPFLLFGVFALFLEFSKIKTSTHQDFVFGILLSMGFIYYALSIFTLSILTKILTDKSWLLIIGYVCIVSLLIFIISIVPPVAYKAISNMQMGMISVSEIFGKSFEIFKVLSIPFAVIFINAAIIVSLVLWRLRRLSQVVSEPA